KLRCRIDKPEPLCRVDNLHNTAEIHCPQAQRLGLDGDHLPRAIWASGFATRTQPRSNIVQLSNARRAAANAGSPRPMIVADESCEKRKGIRIVWRSSTGSNVASDGGRLAAAAIRSSICV